MNTSKIGLMAFAWIQIRTRRGDDYRDLTDIAFIDWLTETRKLSYQEIAKYRDAISEQLQKQLDGYRARSSHG